MEQSIATSQGNNSARKRSGRYRKSVLAGLWSAMTAGIFKFTGNVFTGNVWHVRSPFASDISETLDIDKIYARLNIKDRAESDGRNDQPSSTEERVSGTQKEIVVYFSELRRRAQRRIPDLAEKLRGLGEEIDLPAAGSRLRDTPSRCENKVLRLIAESKSQLNALGEREAQQQEHYAASLENSEPNEVAEQPISPTFYWAIVAVIIGAGAFAIAKLSVSGFGNADLIPPSWAISISISLIVVLASSVIARAVSRIANHVGQLRQLTSWLGSGLGIALIVIMALFAAHYIATVAANPGVAMRGVVDSILANPIAIVADVADWKGFAIVVSAGLVAFLVSYAPNSLQTGHGAIQSAIYRTREKRERLTKRLRKQIYTIIDAGDAGVTKLLKRLKAQISQYSRLVDESKRIPASLSDYDVVLEDGCNILLGRYRAANINARKSKVPMSFSEQVCFTPQFEPDFPVFSEKADRLKQLHQGIVELESEAAQVRQKLRDLNSRAISALEDTSTPD
jgi:hypothetical protein